MIYEGAHDTLPNHVILLGTVIEYCILLYFIYICELLIKLLWNGVILVLGQ